MKAIHLSLSSYKILLINPGIHVNTKEMFEKITPVIPSKRIKEIIKQPVETWKNNLKNNFEEIVFLRYQEIENIKKNLYNHQAVYASMTGTGSTVFAIFNAKDEINYPVEKKYFYKWIDGLV
jgi:4-diphosphocytidyl-2-C-methyl-D-erythritol kinase